MAIGPGFVPAQLPTGQKYFELPFNELLAGLSAKQKQFDEASAELDAVNKLFPEAGYATVQDAEILKSKYVPEINTITEQLARTGKANPALIKSIARKISSDPLYSKVKRDYELRPSVEKMIIEGQAKGDILNFMRDGQVKQMEGNTFNPQHYSFTPYADPYKEIDDQLNLVEAQILEKVGADTWIEPNTGERMIRESGITKKFKNSNTFKDAVEAISKEYEKGNTPGSKYFIERYGYNPALIRETVKTRAIPRYMYQEDKSLNIGSSLGSSKTTEPSYLEEGQSPLTPVSQTTGLSKNYFQKQEVGKTRPYTTEEATEIKKKYTRPSGQFGTQGESMIMQGKPIGKGEEYNDIYKIPEKAKGFVENVIKSINTVPEMKGILEKYNNKTLSNEDKEKIYPVLDKALQLLEEETQTNASYEQISEGELKAVKRIFGDEVTPKVKTLGAGQALNHKFYDKETGKTLTYADWVKEVKQNNPEDETVTIVSKYKGDNPYVLLTGEERFANGKQIVVGGKEYVMTGPQAYTKENVQANAKLRENKAVNKVFNLKFLPMQTVELDLSEGEKGYFDPVKGYVILDKNNNEIITAPSAEIAILKFKQLAQEK